MRRSLHRHPARRSVWRWPVAITVLSLAGLVAALVGDGGWDAASWIGLGVPVVVMLWFGLRRQDA